jgi:hypothetical protein
VPEPQPSFAFRPLELKHIFDFAIRLLRSGFAPMFMSMAMVQLPLQLLTMPLVLRALTTLYDLQAKQQTTGQFPFDAAYWSKNLDLAMYGLVMGVVALAYQLLVTPLGTLTCARLAATRLLGTPCTFGEALAHARQRYWPTQVALAIYLLPLMALAVLVLVFVLIFQRSGNDSGVAVAAIAGVVLIAAGSFVMELLFCRLFMALNGIIQAAEAPQGEGILAQGLWLLRRSYELTANHFWRMVGMLLLLSFVVSYISNGMTQMLRYIFAIAEVLSRGTDTKEIYNALTNPSAWQLGSVLLISGLVALIFPPFWQCYKTLLYFDLRARREAFDLLHLLNLPGGQLED